MGSALGGLCGSDMFQQLKNKYGQEFVKLIIAEKAKDVITTRFGQAAVQLEGIFNDGRGVVSSMVSEKTNYITGLFNQLKAKVESSVPGGLRVVQQLKGQPIEQIVGFNKLLNLIQQIQGKAISELSVKQGVVTQELRVRQQNFIQGINDQKPQLPLYDQLPQALQRQILHKGQEVFVSQIESRQAEILNQIDGEISIQKVKDVITQLLPQQQLNKVSGSAQSTFSNILPGLLSGGFGSNSGGLGGIVNAVGGMFGNNVNSGNNSNGGNALGNIANNIPFLNNLGGNKTNNNNNNNNHNSSSPSKPTNYSNQISAPKPQNESRQGYGYNMNNHFI